MRRMKSAIAKQKKVSMDIKKELEKVMDVITCSRASPINTLTAGNKKPAT